MITGELKNKIDGLWDIFACLLYTSDAADE